MTEQEVQEIRAFLRSKGFSDDAIKSAFLVAKEEECIKELRDGSEDVKRGRDIMEFKPNPGKATLTQVGETQTYLSIDDRGLPIYKEDVDMIKRSQPLAKRLVELQKTKPQEPVENKPLSEMTAQEKMDYFGAKYENEKQTLRTLRDTIDEVYDVNPEDLNMGPDTTENINEVVDDDKIHPIDIIKDSRETEGDWQPGVKFPAGAVEKGLVDPGLGYYIATGRQPETPIEKYYVGERMKRLKPEEKEYYKKLFAGIEKMDYYMHSPESEEKIRRAAIGFTAEKQTDFPGAKHGEEWLRKHEEDIRDSGDVMFGVDLETQGLDVDNEPYPTTEEMKKHIDEQCNKNVSQPTNKDLPFPGDVTKYSYSNILRSMDETHTRKNNDYGDAAYQGYKKFGPAYFLVQLHNKLSRLESLTINNKTQLVKDESIDDTLLDMANYAVMYLESRHRND